MNPKRREVLEILMNLIQSGEIVRDGKLLPEREIAARLDMSRSVVREALIERDPARFWKSCALGLLLLDIGLLYLLSRP